MKFREESFLENLQFLGLSLSEDNISLVINELKHSNEEFRYIYVNAQVERKDRHYKKVNESLEIVLKALKTMGEEELIEDLNEVFTDYTTKQDCLKIFINEMKTRLTSPHPYRKTVLMSKSKFEKISKAIQNTFLESIEEFPPKKNEQYQEKKNREQYEHDMYDFISGK